MSKKLLKNLEGAVIEKVTVDAANRKAKIKTNKGTITLEFTDVSTSTDTVYEATREVEISFKEPKIVLDQLKPPVHQQTSWPFPTGNKP